MEWDDVVRCDECGWVKSDAVLAVFAEERLLHGLAWWDGICEGAACTMSFHVALTNRNTCG